MTCDEAKFWLDVDEVPDEAARDLAAHRRECPACDREFARAERLRQAVADLPMPEMPESYWTGYDARLRARLDEARRAGHSGRVRRLRDRPATTPRAAPTQRAIFRRRVAATVAATAALVTLAALSALWARRETSPEYLLPGAKVAAPLSAEAASALEARMKELDREAATCLRVVRLLDQHEHRRQRLQECQAILLRPDPLVAVDREVNRSAEILVKQADALLRDYGLKDPAVETFRRVAQLFPETGWAEVARRRLDELN